jgi:transposase
MRGRQPDQSSMLCLINVEERVPKDHPLRPIKKLADEALKRLSRSFDRMYSSRGRPSIAPERLLKGMLLMAFYGIRSEVQLCEQLQYNMLFRWFLDMDMMEVPFDHCAFSDNRERLLKHDAAGKFFRQVVRQAKEADLMSAEHFSVDGTLIEAWASMKSFRPKDDDDDNNDGNSWADFKGKKRSNDTHESKTDPEAKLYRKGRGKEAKLAFMAHALMENRNGLLVDFRLSEATGYAERQVALQMLKKQPRAKTVGADAGYNTKDFVADCRELGVTAHVAGKKHSAVDGRTTRHPGYTVSQRIRKRIEQIMGWAKERGTMRKTRYRGTRKNQLLAHIEGAAYNLVRITNLIPIPT